jgi:hypothetical protein
MSRASARVRQSALDFYAEAQLLSEQLLSERCGELTGRARDLYKARPPLKAGKESPAQRVEALLMIGNLHSGAG